MKKFIILAVMAVLSMLGSIGLTSCHNHDNEVDNECYLTYGDSVAIVNIVKQATFNPEFNDPEEVLDYSVMLLERFEVLRLLTDLDPEVVGTICNVLQENNYPITFTNIRSEYYGNRKFYDLLQNYRSRTSSESSDDISQSDTLSAYVKYSSKPPIKPSETRKGGVSDE